MSSPHNLLAGLRPGLEARLLSADEPAPAQIARAMAGRSLEAVHVIAHGQPGAVAFSGGLLDEQALEQHQADLAAIGAALGATGQVLLWCCRTAASAAWTAYVEALAQITGVSVAASRSLVGAAARGGSWQLEGGDGSWAAAPLRPAAMASYPGVLITYSQQTGTANPFNGFDVGFDSTPSFADIDGDLDAVVGEAYGSLKYFKNTGSATNLSYTAQTGTANPFNGIDVGGYSAPSFADIDGDGDLDLVVGEFDGNLNYYLNVVCFLPGTLIATPTGERPIESLQPGDLITTAAGPQPVKFISRTRRHRNALLALGKMPVRINQGALGELGPSRDTFMSPSHVIHLDGHLVEAGALLNGSSIQQLESLGKHEFLTYYNNELESHALIWANGLQVETYFANVRGIGFTREDWDNYDDYIALYGSSEVVQELPLPRIPFARQIPAALRNKFGLRSLPPLTLDLCAASLCADQP